MPVTLTNATGNAGTLFVKGWFEGDEVVLPKASKTAAFGGSLTATATNCGPGTLTVEVKQAINLPVPLLGSLTPYVVLHTQPGPELTFPTTLPFTPVCTSTYHLCNRAICCDMFQGVSVPLKRVAAFDVLQLI